ncbi:acyl carrier protein [Streptomyces sp. NBC_00582]|uniref:acyl carrier protein n=1 Tax=Streptomyces sp. NBC_00582 TaxID=2975783 RepID=UPI001062F69B|nr:acyl carrier protein [Streptomyces sp. NBC_00582]WUB59239.1 acyl carrier protein [Streptomyces sp. NBC_00582]
MPAESATREQIAAVAIDCLATELKTSASGISGADVLKNLPNADSLRLLRVVSKLERHWDIELDDEAVFAATTVDELVAIIEKYVSGERSES